MEFDSKMYEFHIEISILTHTNTAFDQTIYNVFFPSNQWFSMKNVTNLASYIQPQSGR